jgi:hypothetical protein
MLDSLLPFLFLDSMLAEYLACLLSFRQDYLLEHCIAIILAA